VPLQCHISGDADAYNHYSKFANLLYIPYTYSAPSLCENFAKMFGVENLQ